MTTNHFQFWAKSNKIIPLLLTEKIIIDNWDKLKIGKIIKLKTDKKERRKMIYNICNYYGLYFTTKITKQGYRENTKKIDQCLKSGELDCWHGMQCQDCGFDPLVCEKYDEKEIFIKLNYPEKKQSIPIKKLVNYAQNLPKVFKPLNYQII